MFLIWGFRTKSALLARLMLVCGFCGNPAAQTIIHRKKFFTLFFIPVIPLGGPRIMQCAFCGKASKLEKEQADSLVEQARVQAGQAPAQAEPIGPAAEQLPAAEASWPQVSTIT